MDSRYFRAGVGTVIYNEQFEVLLFKRAAFPVGIWQFQQGGIDPGEKPTETLWRELREEVGLTQDDIADVTPYPHWTVYTDYLVEAGNPTIDRLGQAHRWYFLKLHPTTLIDLTRATDAEFSAYRFTTFADALAETGTHKQHIYQALEAYFIEHIQPRNQAATCDL